DPRGYSMLELTNIIKARGFDAKGVLMEWSDLPRSGDLPVIAYLRSHHFVVVLHTYEGNVIYFDPAQGRVVSAAKSQFLSQWDSSAIVVSLRA
ncbi:MAG: cysteine peptidase family C39 domain-containing protein, partial [Cyanobacteria bacterium P01_G01_bin.4]